MEYWIKHQTETQGNRLNWSLDFCLDL